MRTTVLILALILLTPAAAHAADAVVVPVRGTLDGDAARAIADGIRAAGKSGTGTVLLEIDAIGAPESGLALVDSIREIGQALRIVAFVSGRAPGSAAAVALACDKLYMTPSATLGPVPERGPVSDVVAELLADRDVPRTTLRDLHPKPDDPSGLDAAAAETLRIADRVVADREEALGSLGIDPGRIVEAENGRVPRGRLRITGEFRKPYLIPFEGEIDETLAASVRRRIDEAKAAGADLLIFEMDSPGGLVSASMEIGDLLYETKIPTLMLILKEAYSGAALVALAGDEIVMSATGVLGDCQPIAIAPGEGGYEVIGEKIQSPLRAVFRKYAEASGYPVALAESMVTQEMAVDRVTFADGTVLYLAPEDIENVAADHGGVVRREEIVSDKELLTMHGTEARAYGFTGDLVDDRAEALARFGLEESDLTILEETWAEGVSRFLLGIKFLLFLVGLVAAWMEIKAPGFGVPGAISIIAFVLFFGASAVSGISTGLDVALFVLGIVLLVLEVFVIPGFGVAGISGIVLIGVSLYMASNRFGLPSPSRPWEMEAFLDWLLWFFGTIVMALIGMFLVAKTLPHTRVGSRLILSHGGPEGALGLTGSASVESGRYGAFVGRTGRALSTLRPSGRIEIDGEPYSAVSEGDWIEPGDELVVAEVRGNRIVVRKV